MASHMKALNEKRKAKQLEDVTSDREELTTASELPNERRKLELSPDTATGFNTASATWTKPYAKDAKMITRSQVSKGEPLEIDPIWEISRYVRHLGGWNTRRLPDDLRYCCVELASRLPSPLANLAGPRWELQALSHDHNHIGVQLSFAQGLRHCRVFKGIISTRQAALHDISEGMICSLPTNDFDYMKVKDHGLRVHTWDQSDESHITIRIDDSISSQASPSSENASTTTASPSMTLRIDRLLNQHKSKIGCFVVNEDLESLAINELAIGHKMIAGPLPDFAVITVEDYAFFWFQNLGALDYLPSHQVLEFPEQSSGLTAGAVSINPWQQRLKEGLTRCRQSRQEQKTQLGAEYSPTQLDSFEKFIDDEVLVAIAPLWQGLRHANRLHAFGGQDLFISVGELGKIGAVGKRQKFIMPLIFPTKAQEAARAMGLVHNNEGKIGHILLGVADIEDQTPTQNMALRDRTLKSSKGKKNGPNKGKAEGKARQEQAVKVQISIYDSAPSLHEPGIKAIQQKARDIVRTSGWLGDENATPNVSYARTKYVKVPQQCGNNTCGLHTVLNAYAVMLGIPIHPYSERRTSTTDDHFLEQGLEIINLALAGCMDSRTIQAFLNVHGYSEEQDPDDVVDDVQTAMMNNEQYTRCLWEQHRVDRADSAFAS